MPGDGGRSMSIALNIENHDDVPAIEGAIRLHLAVEIPANAGVKDDCPSTDDVIVALLEAGVTGTGITIVTAKRVQIDCALLNVDHYNEEVLTQ